MHATFGSDPFTFRLIRPINNSSATAAPRISEGSLDVTSGVTQTQLRRGNWVGQERLSSREARELFVIGNGRRIGDFPSSSRFDDSRGNGIKTHTVFRISRNRDEISNRSCDVINNIGGA